MGVGGEPVWCTGFHGEIPALAASGAWGMYDAVAVRRGRVERNPACAWFA